MKGKGGLKRRRIGGGGREGGLPPHSFSPFVPPVQPSTSVGAGLDGDGDGDDDVSPPFGVVYYGLAAAVVRYLTKTCWKGKEKRGGGERKLCPSPLLFIKRTFHLKYGGLFFFRAP